MNDRDICRCHHQRGDHHPLLGLCAHATGTREACVCTAFVLVAGSTSTPKTGDITWPAGQLDGVVEHVDVDGGTLYVRLHTQDPRTFTEALDGEAAEFAAAVRRANLSPYQHAVEATAAILGIPISPDLTTDGFYVKLHPTGPPVAMGMDHVADLTTGRGTRLARLAAERRAAVLHPIAQAEAAEQVDVESAHGIDIKGVSAIEVENIEWEAPCYGCLHPRSAHVTDNLGRGLACHAEVPTHPRVAGARCPCPVYVESPPPDACGRCGHPYSLHRIIAMESGRGVTETRCFGTGVDTDGNERARACPCGRMGGYTPELAAEVSPWEKVILMGIEEGLIEVDRAELLCLCGHPESLHGPMERADQLLGDLPRLHTCLAQAVEGGYADSCIEFRPATITHALADGTIVTHPTEMNR